MSDKISAGLGAAMALVGALAQTYKAASDQKIAGIDQEIAREKARDGASAASVQKLKGLEAKKEAEKKAKKSKKTKKVA